MSEGSSAITLDAQHCVALAAGLRSVLPNVSLKDEPYEHSSRSCRRLDVHQLPESIRLQEGSLGLDGEDVIVQPDQEVWIEVGGAAGIDERDSIATTRKVPGPRDLGAVECMAEVALESVQSVVTIMQGVCEGIDLGGVYT